MLLPAQGAAAAAGGAEGGCALARRYIAQRRPRVQLTMDETERAAKEAEASLKHLVFEELSTIKLDDTNLRCVSVDPKRTWQIDTARRMLKVRQHGEISIIHADSVLECSRVGATRKGASLAVEGLAAAALGGAVGADGRVALELAFPLPAHRDAFVAAARAIRQRPRPNDSVEALQMAAPAESAFEAEVEEGGAGRVEGLTVWVGAINLCSKPLPRLSAWLPQSAAGLYVLGFSAIPLGMKEKDIADAIEVQLGRGYVKLAVATTSSVRQFAYVRRSLRPNVQGRPLTDVVASVSTNPKTRRCAVGISLMYLDTPLIFVHASLPLSKDARDRPKLCSDLLEGLRGLLPDSRGSSFWNYAHHCWVSGDLCFRMSLPPHRVVELSAAAGWEDLVRTILLLLVLLLVSRLLLLALTDVSQSRSTWQTGLLLRRETRNCYTALKSGSRSSRRPPTAATVFGIVACSPAPRSSGHARS